MSPAETIELALEIGNRLDVHWGLFVTVHMALLGALVYLDEPLHRVEKVFALIVYAGFAFPNHGMMISQLMLLDAAYNDVVRMADAGVDSELIRRIAAFQATDRHASGRLLINASHIVMAVLVILSIVFYPLMTREAVARPATAANEGRDNT